MGEICKDTLTIYITIFTRNLRQNGLK